MSAEKIASKETAPAPQIENIPPPGGMPLVYANNIAIGNTVFDLRIIFGEIADATATKLTVNQRVQVTLSWHQAKVLSEFLSRHIRSYEEKNGTLVMPSLPGKVSVEGLIPSAKEKEQALQD
jgi:hypothetical protein